MSLQVLTSLVRKVNPEVDTSLPRIVITVYTELREKVGRIK